MKIIFKINKLQILIFLLQAISHFFQALYFFSLLLYDLFEMVQFFLTFFVIEWTRDLNCLHLLFNNIICFIYLITKLCLIIVKIAEIL